jgi:hypothetical protein
MLLDDVQKFKYLILTKNRPNARYKLKGEYLNSVTKRLSDPSKGEYITF